MGRTIVAALALLALAIVGWLVLGNTTGAPNTSGVSAAHQDDGIPVVPAEGSATGAHLRSEHEPVSPPADSSLAAVRGRCVDEMGQPLANCKVEWRARPYPTAEEVAGWTNPEPVMTAAGGAFEFRFAPPVDYRHALVITAPFRGTLFGRWDPPRPGQVLDVGDIALEGAAILRGTIRDTKGVPRPGVTIRLTRAEALSAVPGVDRSMEELLYSRRDGTFRDGPIAIGTWSVRAERAVLVEPESIAITSAGDLAVDIIIRSNDEIDSIQGTVVDEQGRPATGFYIRTSNLGADARVNRDGTFAITRVAESGDGPFHLVINSDAYEHFVSEATHAWGSRDVAIVLRKGLVARLRVRRPDGTPVEGYGVRFLPARGTRTSWSSSWARLRHRGNHPGGVLELPPWRRGKYLLRVEPAEAELAPSPFVEVTLAENTADVEVEVSDFATRELRVETAAGSAIAGTTVELVEAFTEPRPTLLSRAYPADQLNRTSGACLLIHQRGKTGEAGTLVLRGPIGTDLTLRVLGPGHVPVLVGPIRLDDAGPLVVTVSSGATLVGRVTPIEVIGDLREQAGLPRTGQVAHNQRSYLTDVQLIREEDGQRVTFPTDESERADRVLLGDDGTFEVSGIPPGSWDVALGVTASNGGSWSVGPRTIGRVENLADGARRERTFHLPHWRLAHLSGRVFLSGEPAANSRLMLESKAGPDYTGEFRAVETDRDGAFSLILTGAEWWPSLRSGRTRVRSDTPVRLGLGEVHELDIRFVVGERPLRVLAPDGQPVPGVHLTWRLGGRDVGALAEATDEAGRTTASGGTGTYALTTRIRSLKETEAYHEFVRANRANLAAMEEIVVEVGAVTLGPGDESEVVIRLPANWDR